MPSCPVRTYWQQVYTAAAASAGAHTWCLQQGTPQAPHAGRQAGWWIAWWEFIEHVLSGPGE